MNLKFLDVDWDGNGLMCVRFTHENGILKWYPVWEDLGEVFDSAFATEDGLNHGKMTDYLLFICLRILMRALLIRADAAVIKFNLLANELEAQLLQPKT